jgi:hypothetical protein
VGRISALALARASADTYVDWDIDQLEDTLRAIEEGER